MRSNSKMRQEFEVVAKKLGWSAERFDDGTYMSVGADDGWQVWQARDALAQQENKTLRVALQNLMDALEPELTGAPKNVPKSAWAAQWARAAEVLKEQ